MIVWLWRVTQGMQLLGFLLLRCSLGDFSLVFMKLSYFLLWFKRSLTMLSTRLIIWWIPWLSKGMVSFLLWFISPCNFVLLSLVIGIMLVFIILQPLDWLLVSCVSLSLKPLLITDQNNKIKWKKKKKFASSQSSCVKFFFYNQYILKA